MGLFSNDCNMFSGGIFGNATLSSLYDLDGGNATLSSLYDLDGGNATLSSLYDLDGGNAIIIN